MKRSRPSDSIDARLRVIDGSCAIPLANMDITTKVHHQFTAFARKITNTIREAGDGNYSEERVCALIDALINARTIASVALRLPFDNDASSSSDSEN